MSINIVLSNIKDTRKKQKIKRSYVAKCLNITVSGYSRIERGEVSLSIDRLAKISKILGVSINVLTLGLDENPRKLESIYQDQILQNWILTGVII